MQYYLFHNHSLLLDGNHTVPQQLEKLGGIPFSLGDGVNCMASNVDTIPEGYYAVGLRESYDFLSETDYSRAGKAAELLYWDSTHRYCSRCGSPVVQLSPISKICEKCGREIWPQLSPAIIVLITNGDRILLVKSNTFKGTFYGLVAGFVEFGESIEEAVVREIKEETQLEVCSIKYFGSQPWPYPQGLMLGFTAQYKSGELHLQESELCAGGWFDIHNLPEIPKPPSMARKLIDWYTNNIT